jgi:hypothetical protein
MSGLPVGNDQQSHAQNPPLMGSGYHQPPHSRMPPTINPYGSPEPSQPFGQPFGYSQQGSSGHGTPAAGQNREKAPARQHSTQPFTGQPSMALVTTADFNDLAPVRDGFENIVSMAQKYAQAHVNYPSTAKDNQMPQQCKDLLLQNASTTTAFNLMSTPLTRHYLVTKVMVAWCTANVLKHNSFEGFNEQTDKRVKALRSQIYQSKCTPGFYRLFRD